jgi:hypothetical protein
VSVIRYTQTNEMGSAWAQDSIRIAATTTNSSDGWVLLNPRRSSAASGSSYTQYDYYKGTPGGGTWYRADCSLVVPQWSTQGRVLLALWNQSSDEALRIELRAEDSSHTTATSGRSTVLRVAGDRNAAGDLIIYSTATVPWTGGKFVFMSPASALPLAVGVRVWAFR